MRLTEGQKGYVAGFLEGEGCFFIGYQRQVPRPFIRVSQVDPQALRCMQKLFGGLIRYRSENGYNHSPIYTYQASRHQVIKKIISDIYPYIQSPRIKKRAWCLHKLTTLIRRTGGNTFLPKDNLQERNMVYRIWKSTKKMRKEAS